MKILLAEMIGTFFLVLAGLAGAQYGLQLAPDLPWVNLASGTLAVGAVLYVFITLLGPVSGAHFNPAVSLAFCMRGDLEWRALAPYIGAQLLGGVLAVMATHLMFEIPLWQPAPAMSLTFSKGLSEAIATAGLLYVILMGVAQRSSHIPALVALYVAAGYWMTSSSVVANPAVTVARMLTQTPPSLGGAKAIGFIIIQFAIAALVAWGFVRARKKSAD